MSLGCAEDCREISDDARPTASTVTAEMGNAGTAKRNF